MAIKTGKVLEWRIWASNGETYVVAPAKADPNNPAHLALAFDGEGNPRGSPLPFGAFYKFITDLEPADPDPKFALELLKAVPRTVQQDVEDSLSA